VSFVPDFKTESVQCKGEVERGGQPLPWARHPPGADMDKESGSAQLLFTLKAVHAGSSSTDAKTHMQWQPDGNYVAIAGTGRQIQIFDRYGHVVDDVALTAGGVVVEIAWDKDGEVLAILQSGNSAIIMWDAAQRKTLSPVETNMKDLCWMRWSKVGPELAVGSGKGNLIIYNRRTTRMNPLLGKHSKKITCGAWNSANQLALGSEDKTVTLSTEKGDLVLQDPIKGEPTDMSLPEADFQGGAKRLSVCLGRKSLFIKSIGGDVQGPIELTFAPKHGEIHVHRWYDENQILVGFQTGFVMGTSAHKDHAGKELFGAQMFKFPVTGIHLCKPKQRAAVCGENFVKFIDIAGAWTECHDEKIVAPGLVRGVQWTSDGNFLSVVLADGQVLTYLMSMPMVNANAGPFIAYMKSLREVQVRDVTDTANKKGTQSVIKVDVEPDLMAMGGEYVAMAKNNMCWFYTRGEAGRAGQRVNEVDYNSTVDRVCMNATTAAVLHGGKVNLHHITGDPDGKHTRSFPDGSDDSEISTVHLTDAFLIYGTTTGLIEYVSLDDETRPNDFRHICGIKSIWSNPLGTRLVVQDMNLVGYIYSPVSSQLVEIEEFPRQVKTVLWDKKDVGVLAVVGDKGISTYKYTAHSLRSQAWCRLVCKTEAPALAAPIVLINGELHYQTASGVLSKIVLESHSALRSGAAQVESKFEQALALGRFEDAYALAAQLADKSSFAKLRDSALEALDVATAVRVSREIEDCQTVLALEPLMSCEDRNLLGGQVALYLRDYDLAQDMLLSSSRPVAALEMRCSLRQWDKAMRLAETLAPAQTPHICLQYAEQLQSQGEYEGSLQRYQQALQENFTVGGRSMQVQLPPEHVSQCKAGIAKMHMKQGNTTRGMQVRLFACLRACCRHGLGVEALQSHAIQRL
jgi:WD repeat-containing protein 19